MSKNKKLSLEPNPATGQPPALDEIDLGAALPAQAPGFEAPPPKRGRGRPRSAQVPQKPKTRKTRKDKGIKKTPKSPLIDNNILRDNKVIKGDDIDYSDKAEVRTAADLKSQITPKELKFLELYLTGEYTRESAMILAGYEGYSKSGLYYIAGKICNKYESQAEDHLKICRSLGAGEVEVIKGLLSLAKTAKSENVRRQSWADLAKILGLTKEQIEGAGGVTIIFEAADRPQPGPGAPPPLPTGEVIPAAGLPASKKPMMITK